MHLGGSDLGILIRSLFAVGLVLLPPPICFDRRTSKVEDGRGGQALPGEERAAR
jgi:hypothetical protein